MGFVVFVNAAVLLLLATFAAAVAVLYPATAGVFSESAVLMGVTGALVAIAAAANAAELRDRQAFILTATVWLTAALGGALPLWLWGLTPVDALFEAMSGITTTGSTVMSGLDATPRGILLWRALLQGLGGVGFIVTGIALLPMLKVGGMQLFRTESSDKGGKELQSAAQFATATLRIYLALIILCAAAYRLGGMSGFDAITHALTTLSTGGYSNYDASFGHFGSPALQWVATLFMLMGALPFAWYIRVLTRGEAGSEQVWAMLKTLALVIGCLAFWRIASAGVAPLQALREVAFNVVSVVTTTGYATTDYTTWGPFAVVAFLILTAVGGCTGSTAGGMKAMRWILMYRTARSGIAEVRYPHGVFPVRYEGAPVAEEVLTGVIAFFAVFVLSFGVIAMALSLVGLDFSTAVSGSLTSLANVGPGVGGVIGPAGNFTTLPAVAKLILSFGMYLGRLEMMTVLVLFLPTFWRSVRAG